MPSHPAAAAAELDDLLNAYGRHLHALAYHLCGDTFEAARLARECLIAHCLDPGAGRERSEASIRLYLDLIERWRATQRWRGLFARRRIAGGGAPDRNGPLHRALASLDPDVRMVMVLRVGEGLDYEEMAAILRIPADVVRGRVQVGRRRVQARMTEVRFPGPLEKAMNLYLDGRLGGPDRVEFEARMTRDAALRRSVEFHRGLTLEFAEEAPPPPRDFAERARRDLDTRAAGVPDTGPGAAGARRLPAVLAASAAAAVILLGLYLMARAPAGTPPEPGPAAGTAGDQPDPETLEALQSLGYIAGGTKKEGGAAGTQQAGKAPRAAAPTPAPAAPRPERRAAVAANPESGPGPEAPAVQPVAAQPDGEPAAAPVAGDAESAPETAPPPAPAEVVEMIAVETLAAGRPPESGADHEIITAAETWEAARLDPGAAVDFETRWIVLLRDVLGADPPSRLRVESVRRSGGVLRIECRVEHPEPGSAAGPPGQALVLPAPVTPIEIVLP